MIGPGPTPRVSQVVVDQIKVLIREGSLRPGDRLPSERELCRRFGLSRVTVREAMRVLETAGLVTVRVGVHGGAFVTMPTADRVGAGVADLLAVSGFPAREVIDARMILELGALPLIVERATDADVDDLFALVDQGRAALAQGRYSKDMSATFHTRVASSAHNTALTMLIHGPLLLSLRDAHRHAPVLSERGSDEHRELAWAIGARDLTTAQRVLRAHISRAAERAAHD